jgi:hypothetical protein
MDTDDGDLISNVSECRGFHPFSSVSIRGCLPSAIERSR